MALFQVVSRTERFPGTAIDQALLVEDNWDDWAKYRTQFHLWVFTSDGTRVDVGEVKIASIGLKPGLDVAPGIRAPELPRDFDALGDQFFSLGQGETYYEALNTCPESLRDKILVGLRDCARDLVLFEQVQTESAMQQSLLRGVPAENVRGKLHRLALGDATLTRFWFIFEIPPPEIWRAPLKLEFEVEPDSFPPTNVHVLIGRNGVGKSRCLQKIARAVLGVEDPLEPPAVWTQLKQKHHWFTEPDWRFAGLVFVSFSAFDHSILSPSAASHLRTALVGLHKHETVEGTLRLAVKSKRDLLEDFSQSFAQCRHGLRAGRLRAALATLGADPLFADTDVAQYLDRDDDNWRGPVESMFAQLSSGHAIVLLTITRLVELVDERTLVLIDEPEGHLHPPLLSAFIRSLTDLLIGRNGVAIIATHSPVVLQEVPRSCVCKLRRNGATAAADRVLVETFGENVGTLTSEVFGLEVTKSGFHKLLNDAVMEASLDYEGVLRKFGGQLGAEARAIVRALIAERDTIGKDFE